MNFEFTAEQEMVRDTVRAYLADKAPMTRVREVMETNAGFDAALWSGLADLGMLGVHIPEDYGGAGFGFREVGILMEEMGRALTPLPFLSSAVLGAGALLLVGSEEQKAVYLPRIASGELRVALAATEQGSDWGLDRIDCAATAANGAVILSGTKSYVIDGHSAGLLIVAARQEDGAVSMYLVAMDSAGVERSRVETMDMTRRLAEVQLNDVRVPVGSRLGAAGSAGETLQRLHDLAVVALAYEQVGGAQACLEASVEYAKVRHQFGRPIGSFQAIKHKCADMLVQVESAKSAAYHAGWAADSDPEELRIAAPLAKAFCSDAYFSVAAENIQVHGGVGFTWDHDAHLYFKRAKSAQLLFGDSTHWRATLADRLGL